MEESEWWIHQVQFLLTALNSSSPLSRILLKSWLPSIPHPLSLEHYWRRDFRIQNSICPRCPVSLRQYFILSLYPILTVSSIPVSSLPLLPEFMLHNAHVAELSNIPTGGTIWSKRLLVFNSSQILEKKTSFKASDSKHEIWSMWAFSSMFGSWCFEQNPVSKSRCRDTIETLCCSELQMSMILCYRCIAEVVSPSWPFLEN